MEEPDDRSRSLTDDDSPQVKTNLIQRLEGHFWRRIGSGLLVLIPLIVTILVIRVVVNYVDSIFRGEGGFFNRFIEDSYLDFPGVGFIFLVLVLYVAGFLVVGRLGKRLLDWQAAVIDRIPVVRTIFGVAKQVTDTLSAPMEDRFSRVVFIEWPRVGHLALGFVTGHCHFPAQNRALLVIYVPTVPNPTSGNLAFVSEEQIIESNMTVEEAMKIVFSGGIVLPSVMNVGPTIDLSELPISGSEMPVTVGSDSSPGEPEPSPEN